MTIFDEVPGVSINPCCDDDICYTCIVRWSDDWGRLCCVFAISENTLLVYGRTL